MLARRPEALGEDGHLSAEHVEHAEGDVAACGQGVGEARGRSEGVRRAALEPQGVGDRGDGCAPGRGLLLEADRGQVPGREGALAAERRHAGRVDGRRAGREGEPLGDGLGAPVGAAHSSCPSGPRRRTAPFVAPSRPPSAVAR